MKRHEDKDQVPYQLTILYHRLASTGGLAKSKGGVRHRSTVLEQEGAIDSALGCKRQHQLGVIYLGLRDAYPHIALDQDREEPLRGRVHGRDDLGLAELIAHFENCTQLVVVADHVAPRSAVALVQLDGILAGEVDKPVAASYRRLVLAITELPSIGAGALAGVPPRRERKGNARLLCSKLCRAREQRHVLHVLLDAHNERRRRVVHDSRRPHIFLQKLCELLSFVTESNIEAGRAIDSERATSVLKSGTQRGSLLIGHAANSKHVVERVLFPTGVALSWPRNIAEVEWWCIQLSVLVPIIESDIQGVDHSRILGVNLSHARQRQIAAVACDGRDAHDADFPIFSQGMVDPCCTLDLALDLQHVKNIVQSDELLLQFFGEGSVVFLLHDVQVERVDGGVRVGLEIQPERLGPAGALGEGMRLGLHVLDQCNRSAELLEPAYFADHQHVEPVPREVAIEQEKAMTFRQDAIARTENTEPRRKR
eukprot:scaffold37873_cov27-Tisochrysis_lutea.AAC.4